MKGSLVTPAGTAPTEVYEKAPNKFLVIIDSPVSGLSQNGYDGTIAWAQNKQRGLREMSGPEVNNFKRECLIHREIKLRELYPKMTVKGTEQIGERDAYVVNAEAADGANETMYFDVSNGLLLRKDVTQSNPTECSLKPTL
jgi:hypothetical protein